MNTCLFLWKSTTPCLLNGFTNCACLQLSGCKKCPQFKPLFRMNVKFSETVKAAGNFVSVLQSPRVWNSWLWCVIVSVTFWANIPATRTDSFSAKYWHLGQFWSNRQNFCLVFSSKVLNPWKSSWYVFAGWPLKMFCGSITRLNAPLQPHQAVVKEGLRPNQAEED